jgi:hypothetical protein
MTGRAWPLRGPQLATLTFDHPALARIFGIGFPIVLGLSVVSQAALVVRFRRSQGGGAPASACSATASTTSTGCSTAPWSTGC